MTLNIRETNSTPHPASAGSDDKRTSETGPDEAARADGAPDDPSSGDASVQDRRAHYAWTEEGSRETLADELLNELAWQSARDRAGSFAAFKTWHRGSLSLVHLNVIALLEAEGPLSMSRLADLLDVSVASATGIVGRMEQRGYVQREHDTADRRVVLVRLTDAGRRVFDDLGEARRQRLAPVIAELTVEEIRGFLAGLRAMKEARGRLLANVAGDSAACPAPGASPPIDNPHARDIS